MVSHRTSIVIIVLLLTLVLLVPQPVRSQREDFGMHEGEQEATQALAGAAVIAAGGKLTSRGPSVSLPVEVINSEKLGAATVLVAFDPELIKATGCQRSSMFDVGLCNTNVDRDEDGKADAVLFNAVSLTGVSTGTTPVTMATISWKVVARVSADTMTTLGLQVQTFTDVNGNPLQHTAQDGPVVIYPALPQLFLPLIRR